MDLTLKNLTLKPKNVLSILILILLGAIVVLITLGITEPGRFTENKKAQTYIKTISIVSSLLIGAAIFYAPLRDLYLSYQSAKLRDKEIEKIKNDITR